MTRDAQRSEHVRMNIDDLDDERSGGVCNRLDRNTFGMNDRRIVNVELLAVDDQSALQREENDRASGAAPRCSNAC